MNAYRAGADSHDTARPGAYPAAIVLEPSCALTWQVRDAAPAGSGACLDAHGPSAGARPTMKDNSPL
jgi:hypothetical protein